MAFHDTKKNYGYHSLFIKLFRHVWGGGRFPRTRCMFMFNGIAGEVGTIIIVHPQESYAQNML